MKYLKKRDLYNLVVKKLNYADMPKCEDCSYEFWDSLGCAWLSFCTDCISVKISSIGDAWFRVREYDFDGKFLRCEEIELSNDI